MRKPREWLRRSEEIAEQYMKRWFVADKEQVAKRRALEVQDAQQLKISLNPILATAAYCVAIPALRLLCSPIPCQVDGIPPHSATLRRLCHLFFNFVSFCVILVFCSCFYLLCLCPIFVSCLVVGPPAGHRTLCSCCYRFVCLLLVLSLSDLFMPSFCWSISWTYHWFDHTNKEQPCQLGTRPAP